MFKYRTYISTGTIKVLYYILKFTMKHEGQKYYFKLKIFMCDELIMVILSHHFKKKQHGTVLHINDFRLEYAFLPSFQKDRE